MSSVQSVMIKNKQYDGTRLTIVGSQSGQFYYHYSEAAGTRYFVNEIGSATPSMDSVTFRAHLTFTSSGTQSWSFGLIPMQPGETVIINTKVSALSSDGSKGYIMSSFGGYRHSGSQLSPVGGGMYYLSMNDFTGASMSFTASATASINMVITGMTGQIIDWDIHIDYTKGYHSLSTANPNPNPPPWYPPVERIVRAIPEA